MLLLMYISMRRRGATDFGVPEGAALDQVSSKDLQLHHIFPFDFMMRDAKAETTKEECSLLLGSIAKR